MITLDTSGIFALLNAKDPDHPRAKRTLFEDAGPYLVPAAILAEVAYLIERRLGWKVLDAFLLDLEKHHFSIDCAEEDMPRIRELVKRYANLPLGFADASVASCAERNGGKVLTLDQHFAILAREETIQLFPFPR